MSISVSGGISYQREEQALGITINGNGTALTTGIKGYILIPYDAEILSWSLLGDVSGSAIMDIWKASYPNVPTIANSITGSNKPTLSGSIVAKSTSLATWTNVSIAENDMIGYNLDSVDGTLTKLTLILKVQQR